jgi:hypothetical protein
MIIELTGTKEDEVRHESVLVLLPEGYEWTLDGAYEGGDEEK